MIDKDLSEPYSIYTYRYFILGWPKLCISAFDDDQGGRFVGVIVCKADVNRRGRKRGYIAMLAVDNGLRRKGIGSSLVKMAIREMIRCGCDEAVLETEITNKGAMRLYENLGFYRDKRLSKYYLNGVDAFRLKLWLTEPQPANPESSGTGGNHPSSSPSSTAANSDPPSAPPPASPAVDTTHVSS